eukprot:XP_011683741.1 PREDICTED: ribosomal RNA processing protein 1 homolog B [Strongylocentrotus purpuratus]
MARVAGDSVAQAWNYNFSSLELQVEARPAKILSGTNVGIRILGTLSPTVIVECSDVKKVQYGKRDCQKSDKDLMIGKDAKEYLESTTSPEDDSPLRLTDADLTYFYLSVRKYYESACDYALKTWPLDVKFLKEAEVIDVSSRRDVSFSSVQYFVEKYPCILNRQSENGDLDKLELEFAQYQVEDFSGEPEILNKNLRIDKKWSAISKMEDGNACLFFETFLATMRREWMGIDHLRMDKYLMLIRRSFRQMLVVLHNNEWDEELVKCFLTSISRCALNPTTDACPDGLRYQLANVYLDELAREGTEDLSPQQASTFLFPFAELVTKTLNKKLRDVMLQDIFQDVVERSDVGEGGEEEEDEGIASDEDRTKSSKNACRNRVYDLGLVRVGGGIYDYGMIADKLFDLASEKNIPTRNRKPIYRMVERFRILTRKGGGGDIYDFLNPAVQQEEEDETETVSKKKKKKKQKKTTSIEEQTEEKAATVEQTTDVDNEFTELKSAKAKGKKKKGKKRGDDEALVEESVQSEAAVPEGDAEAETFPSPTGASKRKKKKKGKAKMSDESSEDAKSNTDSDSGLSVNKSSTEIVGDSPGDVDGATVEGAAPVEPQTPRTKSKKKGKKQKSPTGDDTNDTNKMELNTVDVASKGSKVKSSQQEGSPKPFAAFEKVSTPPAYVKKSKKMMEPSTLPRAKAHSRVETQFSPPMTRKRVKIALSMNQFQAASEYKQRIKMSPGVPFDGSKKPAFSVLKQTPPRSEVKSAKVKGSSKKSGKVEKKRARATDFF